MANRVIANLEGFQAVGEHLVHSRVPQIPKLRPHKGQHVGTEDPHEHFAREMRPEVSRAATST